MLNGFNGTSPRRQRRSPHRQFRNGQRAAVLRAVTAAGLYDTAPASDTLAKAAAACGTSIPYLRGALALRDHGDERLIRSVMFGHLSLQEAVKEIEPVVRLARAYRSASTSDRVAFARRVGVNDIFETLVTASV
jgi:hypothetical protein